MNDSIEDLAEQVRALSTAPTPEDRLNLARSIRNKLDEHISRWATNLAEERDARRRANKTIADVME